MLTEAQKIFIVNCKDRMSYHKSKGFWESVIGIIIIVVMLLILTIIVLSFGGYP